MNVSNEIKQAFANTSNPRVLDIYFPNLNLSVDMEHIIQESLSLKESVLENDSIEFVGCVASELSIELYGVREELKGEIIEVKIKVRTSAEDVTPPVYTDPIPLFYGRVDSVELEANHNKRKITAYDMLYTAGNIEVADWYNSLNFGSRGITLGQIRYSLFSYINTKMYQLTGVHIEQVYAELPNDEGFYIKKQYAPTTLRSIDVIKSICQINGVFGIINREVTNGTVKFEYRVLSNVISDPTYPSDTLYPPFTPGMYISTGDIEHPSTYVEYYRSIDYQEYTVKPVDQITIRDNEDDKGVPYGSGSNNYIIQGNMFTYKLSEKDIKKIAGNIYPYICNVVYRPFESENDALPWLECGLDVVKYLQYDYEESAEQGRDVYSEYYYYVFNRNMTGIQALKDEYTATGEQDQRQFLTDVNTRIETIKKQTTEIDVDLSDYYTIEEIEDNYYDKEYIDNLDPSGWKVESVSALPAHGEENVLYLIQGEVVVE